MKKRRKCSKNGRPSGPCVGWNKYSFSILTPVYEGVDGGTIA